MYTPYDLRGRRHVFADWELVEPGYGVYWGGERDGGWEMPYGVRISTHKPLIDSQPLFLPEHPWEKEIHGSTSVFEDEGRLRLYYPASHGGTNPEGEYEPRVTMMAYAESSDGSNWTRQTIGQVEFQGSTQNNITFPQSGTIFKDESAAPHERYKLIYQDKTGGGDRVLGAFSPDGLAWTKFDSPILSNYVSDTQIEAKYDPEKGKYVGYFRGWDRHEHGRVHGRRAIAYSETDDFTRWPRPERIVIPDAQDGPATDIYTNAYTPWPDGGDAHLMFPTFYQRGRDTTELHIMTSRDGVFWERHSREPIVSQPDPGTSGMPGLDWHTGVYAGTGLVNAHPDEDSLIISPSYRSHNNLMDIPESHLRDEYHRLGYLCKATWRKDGFTSIEAEDRGGFTTYPILFNGGRLELNAWTRFRGEIKVEVADATVETRPNPAPSIPGRTLADCDPITGDSLSRVVTWNGESDLSAWSGRQVRLRIQMTRARLHTLRFI